MIERLANRVSSFNRRRKYGLFMEVFEPGASTKILDVGAAEDEYPELANLLEKEYPYPENITALGIDEFRAFRERYPPGPAGELRRRPVPLRRRRVRRLLEQRRHRARGRSGETDRVPPRGSAASLGVRSSRRRTSTFRSSSTRRIPLLHFLPKAAFDWCLTRLGKSFARGEYMNLLGIRDAKALMKESGIDEYRIVRNRLCGFTMDFVMIF